MKITRRLVRDYLRQMDIWFLAGAVLVIVLAVLTWYVWQRYGDQRQITAASLQIATILFLLNGILATWAFWRERQGSYLLLGATIVIEIITIVFLYIV